MNAVAKSLPRPPVKSPVRLAAVPRPVPRPVSKVPPAIRDRAIELELADADIVEAVAAPTKTKTRATPPPAPTASVRFLRDPLAIVREAVGELSFFGTSWQAASVCAAALAKALGARAVIIHSHDVARQETRIIAAKGAGSESLLGASALVEDDAVAGTVVSNDKPMMMFLEGGLPRVAPDRLRAVCARKLLVAAPAMAPRSKAIVAIVEVIDPSVTSQERIHAALGYVATELAKFLSP